MRTKLLICAIFISYLSGCTAIPATIDDRLSYQAENAISDTSQCTLPYTLSLDEQSAQLTLTQPPSGFTGAAYEYSFPIGKTLASYLEQAHRGNENKNLPLSLDVKGFEFELIMPGLVGSPKVDKVKYEAIFNSPNGLGEIHIQEDIDQGMQEARGTPGMFYLVSQALQSTTVKLFKEANKRLCNESSSGGG